MVDRLPFSLQINNNAPDPWDALSPATRQDRFLPSSQAALASAVPRAGPAPNRREPAMSESSLLPPLDLVVAGADAALRTLFANPQASRPCPTLAAESTELDAAQKAEAGALMRVNHVGEVCAQALYTAQAMATRDPALRAHFARASAEETDHLAWTRQRLDELGSRPSLLNPLWYAGAFGIGLLAGRFGDRVSLGFVVETERQVEAHLEGHMQRLPAADHASRAIVAQMKDDEARHALQAQEAGALPLPTPVRALMRAAAKLMTTVAHRI